MNPQINQILQTVAQVWGVTPAAILAADKHRLVSEARHASMTLARKLTRLTLQQIGADHQRSHSDVMICNHRARDLKSVCPIFAARYREAESKAIALLCQSQTEPPLSKS